MRLLLTALVLIAGTLPAEAQWLDRSWPDIPRTADGKPALNAPARRTADGKPDLAGVWNGPNPEPRIDSANALPWVNDLVRQRAQDYQKARPFYRCLPSGPESDRVGGGRRILKTPPTIGILNDDLTNRLIFMNGRHLESTETQR